ncbi:hypothetical protein FOXB_03474, partial [Fusarium oxysporum f. sp. conglutinans Fo5176]
LATLRNKIKYKLLEKVIS